MKLLIIAVAVLFISRKLAIPQANFSGNWTRDTEQCDAGGLSINSIPIQIKVRQNLGSVEIQRISRNRAGDTSKYVETLKFDGTQTLSLVKHGLHKNATITTTNEGGLTEHANYNDDKGNHVQEVTEAWSLSAGKKVLTIRNTLTANGSEYHLTEVFRKE